MMWYRRSRLSAKCNILALEFSDTSSLSRHTFTGFSLTRSDFMEWFQSKLIFTFGVSDENTNSAVLNPLPHRVTFFFVLLHTPLSRTSCADLSDIYLKSPSHQFLFYRRGQWRCYFKICRQKLFLLWLCSKSCVETLKIYHVYTWWPQQLLFANLLPILKTTIC